MAKNKGGRPQLSDDEVRKYTFKIGLNQHEFETFCGRAELVGLSETATKRANFIRKILMNQPINSVASVNLEAKILLNRMNGNLNKISMHPQITTDDLNEISKVKAEIAKLSNQLLGL